MPHILTTCTYCGVGCGVYLTTDGVRITGVFPSSSHPCNKGRLCIRGWHLHELAMSPHRMYRPLVRKNGTLEPVSWIEAFAFIHKKLNECISKYGPSSIAFYTGPRSSNEDAYLLQKFARVIIGTNNVDHGAGAYSNASLDILMEMMGIPGSTASIEDIMKAEVILIDEIDLAKQLPTIGGWILHAKDHGIKIISVNPRLDVISKQADIHLNLRPGTELWLYGAIGKFLIEKNFVNHEFLTQYCDNVEVAIKAFLEFDISKASKVCDIPSERIEEAATILGKANRIIVMYSTGLEVREPNGLRALLNLVLLRGGVGRSGAGILALTEHCNLQGTCDVGALPRFFPGYRSVKDLEARKEFERIWKIRLSPDFGISAQECFQEGEKTPIKAVWLLRYDPMIASTLLKVEEALAEMELVIVQDLFPTRLLDYATVVIPTPAFGEEEGTFTNTERRVQKLSKAKEPPFEIIPAWKVLTKLADLWGHSWRYEKAADVFDEIKRVVPFYAGIDYYNLSTPYGVRWYHGIENFQEPQACVDFNKKLRMSRISVPFIEVDAGQDYPFALVFGRHIYYWNLDPYVQNSETLKREYRVLLLDYPDGFVELHPKDALQIGVKDGQRVKIISPMRDVETVVRITEEVRPGTIYVPFYVREVVKGIWKDNGEIGSLTRPIFVRVESIKR